MLPDGSDRKPGWPRVAGRLGMVAGAIAGGVIGVIAIVSAFMRAGRKPTASPSGTTGAPGGTVQITRRRDPGDDVPVTDQAERVDAPQSTPAARYDTTVAEETEHGPSAHDIPVVQVRPGWSLPRPAALPMPSYWPAVLGLAVTLLFWGFVSSFIISVVGLALFAIGLAGWIGDLRHAA